MDLIFDADIALYKFCDLVARNLFQNISFVPKTAVLFLMASSKNIIKMRFNSKTLFIPPQQYPNYLFLFFTVIFL